MQRPKHWQRSPSIPRTRPPGSVILHSGTRMVKESRCCRSRIDGGCRCPSRPVDSQSLQQKKELPISTYDLKRREFTEGQGPLPLVSFPRVLRSEKRKDGRSEPSSKPEAGIFAAERGRHLVLGLLDMRPYSILRRHEFLCSRLLENNPSGSSTLPI